MLDFLDKIRRIDFGWFYSLYHFGQQNPGVENTYIFLARYGILLSFLAFIYLIWNKRINALICSMLSVGLSGLSDLVIYLIWKRPRPFIAHADFVLPNTSGQMVDVSSFPSSHTYIAFAIATSILLYGHKKLGWTLMLVAILIAVSRIGTGLHYPSDVIAGAFLGIASGIVAYMIVQKYEKYWEEPANVVEGAKRDQT